MNGLGTIQHDYNSPWLDKHLQHSSTWQKTHKQKRRDNTFRVNPKWCKAYTGRSEYEGL